MVTGLKAEYEKLKNKQLMEELEKVKGTMSKHFKFDESF
jgi:hypothetical protein